MEFTDFSLSRAGLVFELHPTERPVLVAANGKPALEVCPVGTSFSTAWRRGCLPLDDALRALPSTSGAIHVVFRVRPPRRTTSHVRRLELRWHCVDRRFGVFTHGARVPREQATFDC